MYPRTIDAPGTVAESPVEYGFNSNKALEFASVLENHSQMVAAQTVVTQETLAVLRQQNDINQAMLAALHKLPNAVAEEVRRHTLIARMKRILKIDNDKEEEGIKKVSSVAKQVIGHNNEQSV
jgi:predicted transposase YbfD/YdcC